MARQVTVLLVITVLQSVVRAQDCQHTCTCSSIATIKGSPLRAECREEPSGEWAKNIKIVKIRFNLQQLTTTTLQDAWKVTDADLRFCNITQIMPNALAKVINLSTLWLSHNLIEKVDLEAFSKLDNLKRLYLDNNRLVTFSANTQTSLKYLAKLFLQRNNLTNIPQLSPVKYLDVSNNKITTFNTQLMANLTYLDACMNPINNITNSVILKELKSLCLSGNINNIPGNFSTNFLSLRNFTFISYPNKTTLNNEKYNISMPHHNITAFHIGNTNLENLLFLRDMVKMERLKLQGVSLADFGSIDLVLSSFQRVKNLDFEDSPALVKIIVDNFQSLQNLSNLETVSFRNSNVVHLPCGLCQMQRFLKIDFRNNPLDCDCRISEIEASLSKPLRDYIILPEKTMCQSPQQVFGWPIYKYGRDINCSRKEVCSKEHYTCKTIKILETTTSSSLTEHDDDNSIYYIILGVVIAILGTVIIGLIIISIILKKERRIEPQQEIPSQSFQQLQQTASEDTFLI